MLTDIRFNFGIVDSAASARLMMKFETGYTVETVFDGSKLGVDPYAVEMLPTGDLIILDSASSNVYRISSSMSLCKSIISFLELHFFYHQCLSLFVSTRKSSQPISVRVCVRVCGQTRVSFK